MKSWNQYNEEALSLLITKKYKKKTNYIWKHFLSQKLESDFFVVVVMTMTFI